MALKQKTVYFREEDLPKWEAVPNKAEWLHEHLNSTQWIEGGRTHQKAKPGTTDPTTGMEINEFISNSDKVQNIVEGLIEPTITEPEETA